MRPSAVLIDTLYCCVSAPVYAHTTGLIRRRSTASGTIGLAQKSHQQTARVGQGNPTPIALSVFAGAAPHDESQHFGI